MDHVGRSPCPLREGLAVLMLVVAGGCARAPGRETDPGRSGDARISPPARTIRVEPDAVVVEGRWERIAGTAGPLLAGSSVRVVCTRPQSACREELTTLVAGSGQELVHERLDYEVKEWTPARLLASRRTAAAEVQLRISLSGLAAEKVVIERGERQRAETHWRLE